MIIQKVLFDIHEDTVNKSYEWRMIGITNDGRRRILSRSHKNFKFKSDAEDEVVAIVNLLKSQTTIDVIEYEVAITTDKFVNESTDHITTATEKINRIASTKPRTPRADTEK